jgi:chemotaxis protein MotB
MTAPDASWKISGARADAARAMLQSGGLASNRIYETTAKAGSEPLLPEDPNASANRWLSIVLLREAPHARRRPAGRALRRFAKPLPLMG